MPRNKKIRFDRVILGAVIGIVVLFGVYKGLQFAAEGVMAFFGSTPAEEKEPEAPVEKKITVIIDAGHGAVDGGAKNGKILEKNITLKFAKAIGPALEKENINVVYTRTDDNTLHSDRFTDLKMRAEMSAKNEASCFVSIHVNDVDNPKPEISGFEIFTKNNDEVDINEKSTALAKSIGKEMESLNYSKNKGLQSGKELRVLRLNTVPAVLVETGYIRGNDINYLNDDAKIKTLGESIAKGIIEYLKVNK
ncbi:MAG: N-acetylmuramoyl-L-alanine amidase [Coprobacillus sp.]